MIIGFIKKLLILIIFFAFIVFSISNKENIAIGFLPFNDKLEIPVFLFVVILLFLGGLLGIIFVKISNLFNK
tara:strand:- start:457 stop:672 length:216 start_codon:yes stop_codon:yes gene_type:complete